MITLENIIVLKGKRKTKKSLLKKYLDKIKVGPFAKVKNIYICLGLSLTSLRVNNKTQSFP